MSQEFTVEGSTGAARADVWRLLADSASWPAWTPIDAHREEQAAGPDGTGEVRVFRNGRYVLRERVVEVVPAQRLAYTLLSGLAVRDYLASVELSERPGGGTQVRWHTTFRPTVPGTGWLYRAALRRATRAFVSGLVRAAATGPAGAPPA